MVNTPTAPSLPSPAVLQTVPVSEDVIEYTIACALALLPPETRPDIRDHMAHQASQQARRVFGGDRMYISRKAGAGSSQRNAQIKRDYLAGERIPLLERRYSLGARQIWYIIKS